MVLGYFIFRIKTLNGFKPLTAPWNTEPLDVVGIAASYNLSSKVCLSKAKELGDC